MSEVMLFKLKSGETIISEMLRVETITKDKFTDEKYYWIRRPWILTGGVGSPWVQGLDDPDTPLPLPFGHVVVCFPEWNIDPIELNNYNNTVPK